MWGSKSYQTHEDHMTLYEALEKSMARDNRDQLLSDLAEARKKKKKRQGSHKTPLGSPPHPLPPPPPPAGPSGTLGTSGASGSSQSPPPFHLKPTNRVCLPVILEDEGAYYPDVGLEQMVPDQMWIEEECKYDVDAIVVRIEVFSMYGTIHKKIVLRRADLKEYVIAERDFKYMHPSDFEDLYLLNLQEDFQLGIESYQTQLTPHQNRRWDARDLIQSILHSNRLSKVPSQLGQILVQMIMSFKEIHYVLVMVLYNPIEEALDYKSQGIHGQQRIRWNNGFFGRRKTRQK
ncbi:hypothetical protein Tco_0760236 [Tanacetum coccineum]